MVGGGVNKADASGISEARVASMVRSRVLYVRSRGGVERACAYAALARVMDRVCARVAPDREIDAPKFR